MDITKANIEAALTIPAGYTLGHRDAAIVNEMARRLLAAEAQLAAVVAENAALKEFDIDEFREAGPYQPDDSIFGKLKTPATDAFIAEQRAVGVEMFAEVCSTANNGREIHPDIEEIKAFAAQLRNEVKV